MGVMRVIDRTGDSRVAWRVDDETSVDRARAIFDRLHAERQLAFVRPAGSSAATAERVWTFDPGAEEILWVRPVTGG
ncbi:MAG: hypothetical protein ACRDYB_11430 [Acidimicrobiales bacterium]